MVRVHQDPNFFLSQPRESVFWTAFLENSKNLIPSDSIINQTVLVQANNLSFGLSSSESEEFAQQILGFSGEINGQGPFMRQKNTRDASKLPEYEGEKPKIQVNTY